MWLLRKFYAGNGGCLPPTDPRITAMTDAQIDLEFAHIELDMKSKNGGNSFEDEDYEKYEKETDELDNITTDDDVQIALPKPSKKAYDPEDWEDVGDDEDF